jgi:hypothetical protein
VKITYTPPALFRTQKSSILKQKPVSWAFYLGYFYALKA